MQDFWPRFMGAAYSKEPLTKGQRHYIRVLLSKGPTPFNQPLYLEKLTRPQADLVIRFLKARGVKS